MRLYAGYTPIVTALLTLAVAPTTRAEQAWTTTSPDRQTTVTVKLCAAEETTAYRHDTPRLYYEVAHKGRTVVFPSPLGIEREDQSFLDDLHVVAAGTPQTIDETYTMLRGKRRACRNHAAERTLVLGNSNGANVELIIRAYDNGAALRYRFPGRSGRSHTVADEATGFCLPRDGGKVWAHPYDRPTEYTPAYETYYVNGAPVGTLSRDRQGWAFPLLFCNGDQSRWGLITEAGLDGSYCGCRLSQEPVGGVYRIRSPDPGEGNGCGPVQPSSTLPWATPWRVIIVGDSPGDIVESTLVTDLSEPCVVEDTSWIKPGRASWSWLFDHDSPQDCDKLKAWVDLAARMGWEYSLVDANWTIMKNGTIHDLIDYANSKGVGLLLWYNSGGPHNYVSEMPRGLMYFEKIRRKEFRRLRDWGIKGVKVDFFQSDKQNIIQLYRDILEDAADFQIMVNFHGCTLPRGWSRTYPHLMTMEAVRGEECYSFDRQFTEEAPTHNTIIPFTRNVVGPMDYTPVMFADNVYPHRTSHAHELALPVVFESGWLHFADGIRPYLDLPEAPKQFLQSVPVTWDETKFLAGHPGEYVVLARRHGDVWYIGGISGEDTGRDVDVELAFLDGKRYVLTLIADGENPRSFETDTQAVTARDHIEVRLLPYGGFTATLTPTRGAQTVLKDNRGVERTAHAASGKTVIRPVADPAPQSTHSRPPIIHWPLSEIRPLSGEQIQRILHIVLERHPQKDIWFLLVRLNMQRPNYRVQAYCVPDRHSERVRRGKVVYIHCSGETIPPRVFPRSYAHVCEAKEPFPEDLAVPNDLAQFPFLFSGTLSDDELIEVVEFIRSAPSIPDHLHLKKNPDGTRSLIGGLLKTVRHPSWPITYVHAADTGVHVKMGLMAGPDSHVSESYTCRKIDGTWTLSYGTIFIE